MLQRQRVLRATAYGSAALALLSAGVSAYWTAGGTALLSTVGGHVEALARLGGTSALVLGTGTTAAKLAAVALSLSLVRPLDRPLATHAALAAGAVLTAYGAMQIVVGGLALLGMIGEGPADPTALRWHVMFWDPWFLLWGLLLCTAAKLSLGSSRRSGSRLRRQPPDRVDGP